MPNFVRLIIAFAVVCFFPLSSSAWYPLNDTGIQFCGEDTSGNNNPCLGTQPQGQDTHYGQYAAARAETGVARFAGTHGVNCAGTVYLPKTGQSISYGTRDDGSLQKGASWPNPRFRDNGNGTITDNLTGLVWLKNIGCLGTKSWREALALANGLANGACGLTDGSQAGDWYLPNILQLQSLVNRGADSPNMWLYAQGFIDARVHQVFWSSTTNADNTNEAWLLPFYYGTSRTEVKTANYLNVWPVRNEGNIQKTGQTVSYARHDDGALQKGTIWPDPRFSDNGDGTIADRLTGLVWLKNANCFRQMRWTEALVASNSLASGQCGLSDGSVAGDWHLPNISELTSLVNWSWSNTGRWLGIHGFFGVHSSPHYWTGTTVASSAGEAWGVYMDKGWNNNINKHLSRRVWPVRHGQSVQNSLSVLSTGASSVLVAAIPAIYGGTTNYTKTNIRNGTRITLIAPPTRGATRFLSWTGCNSTHAVNRTCTVFMNGNKVVRVNYSSPNGLRVLIEPPQARQAGAAWRKVGTQPWRPHGFMELLAPGPHVLQFKPVQGWRQPPNRRVAVQQNRLMTVRAHYTITQGMRVLIEPAQARQAGAGWRKVGTQAWRPHGFMERLATGPHAIQFRPVQGWRQPPNRQVIIQQNRLMTIQAQYTITQGLRVMIEPPLARQAGAAWRKVGTQAWRPHGFMERLAAGPHAIQFRPIQGWRQPPNRQVAIQQNRLMTVQARYTRP